MTEQPSNSWFIEGDKLYLWPDGAFRLEPPPVMESLVPLRIAKIDRTAKTVTLEADV